MGLRNFESEQQPRTTLLKRPLSLIRIRAADNSVAALCFGFV